ncbi:MAG: SIMPL domain-containing protein [Candidatus Omnitrophica bacterium]|nr:SIMPL domain-containing protein [Candidatus Omnitrophota bacterium]
MKKYMMVGVLTLFIAALSYTAYAASECNTRCCDEEYPKLIVEGQGEIEVIADKAYFNIRMRAEEKKLERAFEVSTERINSIQETLTSFGVKKEDIRNLGYVYYPLYEGKRIFSTIARPTSYEVIHNLKITLYKLDDLGKILARLADIAETTVSGLTYTATNVEQLRIDALKKAADNARQKALQLAEGSGATLGKVLKIQSGVSDGYDFLREEQLADSFAKRAIAKAEIAPQIESGYLKITANCTVIYSVE